MTVEHSIEFIDPIDSKILTQGEVDKIRKLLEQGISVNIAESPISPKGMIETDVKMFATKPIQGKGIIHWFKNLSFVREEFVRLILKIGDSIACEDVDAMVFMKCSSFQETINVLKERCKRLVYRALR